MPFGSALKERTRDAFVHAPSGNLLLDDCHRRGDDVLVNRWTGADAVVSRGESRRNRAEKEPKIWHRAGIILHDFQQGTMRLGDVLCKLILARRRRQKRELIGLLTRRH